jgi:competence protein ComEA
MTPYPPTGVEPERLPIESAARAGEPKFRLPRAGGAPTKSIRDSIWAPVVRKTALGFIAVCGVALLGMRAPVGMPSEVPASSPQVAADDVPDLGASRAGASAPSTGANPQATAIPPCRPSDALPSPAASSEPRPIGVNTATAQQLDTLPGVGPKKAEEILKLRARLGKFKKLSDLLRVRGVSAKTLQKWKGLIILDEPIPADVAAPGAALPAAAALPVATQHEDPRASTGRAGAAAPR